tara:strand:+ start:808 stop:1212 length:405 start_codon:yes stop_codon:yes gene_type:complete
MKNPKKSNRGYRGYIFSRKVKGLLIPQKVQNLVIRDYADRKELFFKLSKVEYSFKKSYLMLKSLLKEIKHLNGLIIYSINLLPEKKSERKNFLSKIIKNKKQVHFALEELVVRNKKELEKVEDIYFIKENSRNI